MDIQTIVILILSSLLSAAIGFMYGKRVITFPKKMKMKKDDKNKKMKKDDKDKKMKKDDKMKKGGPVKLLGKVKPEGAFKGEPAAVQSKVAQYVLENGL